MCPSLFYYFFPGLIAMFVTEQFIKRATLKTWKCSLGLEKQLCVHNFFLILLQTKGPTFIISYSFQRDIGNKMVQEIRTFLRCCDFVDSKLTSPLTSFARPAKIIEGFWTWMANWISGSGISVFDLFSIWAVQFINLNWVDPRNVFKISNL